MLYHFIVSVGTSLISNYEKQHPETDLMGVLQNFNPFENLDDRNGRQDDDPGDFSVLKGDLNLPDIEAFEDEECQGAEQKSAGKVIEEKALALSDVCFHLIATRTGEGAVCAAILKEIWKESQVNVHFPMGFGKADESGFADTGLPNLLNEIAEIMKEIEMEKNQGRPAEAIIIPTGGYKAIIPYLTISSILYGYPAYYIYEDSDTHLELPALPVGVDVPGFRAVFSLLENVAGADKSLGESYLKELPPEFQKLLYLDITTQKYAYTAFGKRLRKMYRDSKGGELVVKASRNRLLNRLTESYQSDFQKLVQVGPSLWLGDKAPEMADHARYHHLNLFSYAELLLLPLFKERPEFLKPEELLLLLGMIYLHDCGHTSTELPQKNPSGGFIPLLHSEIRNFHNLLGYYRIKDAMFQNSLKRQGVNLTRDFYDAVASASVYHRKKMPLLKNDYNGPDGEFRKALLELTLSYKDTEIPGDRAALMGALFRIIDGMDKQVDRAGDVLEIVMKAESILAELPGLWRRSEHLGECLNVLSPERKNSADQTIKQILKDYMGKESPAGNVSPTGRTCGGWGCGNCESPKISPPEKTEESLYQVVQKAFGDADKHLLPLYWEYLTTRSRFSFLAMQPYFYYTDVLLGSPRISHYADDGSMFFTVDYQDSRGGGIAECRSNLENIWEILCERVNELVPGGEPETQLKDLTLEAPEKVVSGIRDEYCSNKTTEVAQILDRERIKVRFTYNNQAVPCWKKENESTVCPRG